MQHENQQLVAKINKLQEQRDKAQAAVLLCLIDFNSKLNEFRIRKILLHFNKIAGGTTLRAFKDKQKQGVFYAVDAKRIGNLIPRRSQLNRGGTLGIKRSFPHRSSACECTRKLKSTN